MCPMSDTFLDFHDGRLTGVRLFEQSAILYLRRFDDSEHELTLEGLESLEMSDFRQGNIVQTVEIVTGSLPYEHAGLQRLTGSPHPAAEAKYHEAATRILERESQRIARGETTLVIVHSSYGADLIAICRNAICRPA